MCDHEARSAPPATAGSSGTAHLDVYGPPASSSAAPAASNGSSSFPGSGVVPWATLLSHTSHVPSPLSQTESANNYVHSQSHASSGSPSAADAATHASPQQSPAISASPHGTSYSAWASAFARDEEPRSNLGDGVSLLSETALASSQSSTALFATQSQQAHSRTASFEHAAASAGRSMPMPAASYSQAPPSASINPTMLMGSQYAPVLLQNQHLQQQQQQQNEHLQRQQQQKSLQQTMQQQNAHQVQQQEHQQHVLERQQDDQQQQQHSAQGEQQPEANAFAHNTVLNNAPPVGLSAQDEALFNQLRGSQLLNHYLQHTFGNLQRSIEAASRHNDDVRLMLQNEERVITAQRVEVNSLAAEQRRWAAQAEDWSLLRTQELDTWEQRLAHRSLLLMQREAAVGAPPPAEADQAHANALVTNSGALQAPSSSATAMVRRSTALQERGVNGSSMPTVDMPASQQLPEHEAAEPPLKKKRAAPKTRGTPAKRGRGAARTPRMTKAQKLAQAAADEAAAAVAATVASDATAGPSAMPAVANETAAPGSSLFSPRMSLGEKEFAGTAFAGAAPLDGGAAPSPRTQTTVSDSKQL